MSNRPWIACILLLVIQSTAGAGVYRCELADGRVIYSDKPVNLSDACQALTEDSATEYLSVQQGTPRRPTPDQPVAADRAAERETATETPPESWLERATSLVDDYNDALARRRRQSYLANKRKALNDMAIIKTEKKALMEELRGSSLTKPERDKIRGILEGIPDGAQ